MTYSKGSPILSTDYNGFVNIVNNVYGIGTGDHGYGQTSIAQVAVNIGNPVRSAQWTNLMHMITTCANHQGTSITGLPPDTVLAVGKPIVAHTNNPYAVQNYVTTIDTNRFNTSPASLAIATNVFSVTRAGSWSNTITAEVSAIWGGEDSARAFFNSGGQIRLHGAHPTGTLIDNKWNTILNGLGLVKFAVHATTSTGSPGAQNIGYFELTNVYQAIYNMAQPGAYNPNIIALIEAKRLNFAGLRGGNGNGVQFRITLSDTGPYVTTTVSTGTSFSFDNVRATTYLINMPTPTYATVDPF